MSRNRHTANATAAALAAAFVSLALLPMPAFASPWVLPDDVVIVGQRLDYGFADREFLDNSSARAFPLRGQLQTATLDTSARVGMFGNFELELSVPVKLVSYRSDPVILLDQGEMGTLDDYQENVIDLSQTTAGVGDVRLTGRWQAFRTRYFVGATELQLKTPTGYDGPAGTFGSRPANNEEFLANVGTFVRPENVQDDVTLGDGQVDLSAAFLAGMALPSGLFVRADLGFRLRLQGAGDEVFGGFKLGQAFGNRVILFAGSDVAFNVQDGDIIGVSVAAIDPELPATEYAGLDNLDLREVPLDREFIRVEGGLIVRIRPGVEGVISYGRLVYGRNIAEVQTVSFGVNARFGQL
jgi:hypothetical protein